MQIQLHRVDGDSRELVGGSCFLFTSAERLYRLAKGRFMALKKTLLSLRMMISNEKGFT